MGTEVAVRRFIVFLLFLLLISTFAPAHARSCVVLLHGLARTANSMDKLARELAGAGYATSNIDYPSRTATIEELAARAIPAGLHECQAQQATPVHFVTHSLGGILVRQYFSEHNQTNLGRVVMLAPPNHGSEVVDALIEVPGYHFLNGPAGLQLGTDENSVPNRLGPVDFNVGVIAGTETFNPILSQLLPNPDDGKVSVQSTKLEGMCGFLTLPVTHTFIMRSDVVIEQVMHYLDTGRFSHEDAIAFNCERA